MYVAVTDAAFAALTTAGRVTAWGSEEFGGVAPVSVSSPAAGEKITAVFASKGVFVAVHSSGGISAWGNSTSGGDLGTVSWVDLNLTSGVQSVFSCALGFVALDKSGKVGIWGAHNLTSRVHTQPITEVVADRQRERQPAESLRVH